MPISTIKNRNFEKLFMNPFNRTKVNFQRKKFFWISLLKNLVPCMLSHRENVRVRNSGVNRRIRSKIFFGNLPRAYKDLIQVKKFKIISCLCIFKDVTLCRHLKRDSHVLRILFLLYVFTYNLRDQVDVSLDSIDIDPTLQGKSP